MKTNCKITKCFNTNIVAKGLCVTHYHRNNRWGSPFINKAPRHGYTGTPEYIAWKNMKTRCYNKNLSYYKHYGGRGIKVCDRWLNSYPNFLADLGKKPNLKNTLDRVDVNGDYEPKNCRWADWSTQATNQRIRQDNKSGHKNIHFSKSMNKWIFCIQRQYKRKSFYFKTLDEALEFKSSYFYSKNPAL